MKPTMKRGKWASVPNPVYLISIVARKGGSPERESRGLLAGPTAQSFSAGSNESSEKQVKFKPGDVEQMVQGEAKTRNSCPGCGMMLSHYITLVNRKVPTKPEFDLTGAVVHSKLVVSATFS